jgi:hypothetical protein
MDKESALKAKTGLSVFNVRDFAWEPMQCIGWAVKAHVLIILRALCLPAIVLSEVEWAEAGASSDLGERV